jgi:hypothetical protein
MGPAMGHMRGMQGMQGMMGHMHGMMEQHRQMMERGCPAMGETTPKQGG